MIMYFESIESEKLTRFIVHENVVLFSGENVDDAIRKAEVRGREEERIGNESGLRVEETPVRQVFGGIRQLIEIDLNDDPRAIDSCPALDNCELTYLVYFVDTREELNELIKGGSARVQFDDV